MQILTDNLLRSYIDYQPITLHKHLAKLDKSKVNITDSIVMSSVNSSMIEGVNIDMNSFYRANAFETFHFNKDYLQVKDLIEAYNFANFNKLTPGNVLKTHGIITKTLLPDIYQGVLRDKEIIVKNNLTGKVVYSGCPVAKLKKEYSTFIKEVCILAKMELNETEVFYYAALLHFMFAAIHPFADGNGRAARLLEKWFLAAHIGTNAWAIPTEYMYNKRKAKYYKNLASVGNSYETLIPGKILDFLMMLPHSLTTKLK
jgi:Fic family protein